MKRTVAGPSLGFGRSFSSPRISHPGGGGGGALHGCGMWQWRVARSGRGREETGAVQLLSSLEGLMRAPRRGDFRRKEGGKRCRRHVASSSCLARAFSMTTRTSPPSRCRSLRLFLFLILFTSFLVQPHPSKTTKLIRKAGNLKFCMGP